MTDTSLDFLTDLFAIDHVAELLDSSPSQLKYLLYGRSKRARYHSFEVAKRRGGKRTIHAPRDDLKSLQRRLADLIQSKVDFRPSAHGFIRDRSIVTNAQKHVQHRVVLNIDLRDFFPSINFGRVRGVLMAAPLKYSPRVATVLAQICCHDGCLPQGAPTSPVISNMICYRLDAQLQRLAGTHGCIYTRYADDLSFSKRKGTIPSELAVESDGVISVGKELREVIEKNGFQIHPDKVRLYRNTSRQTVTGLVVNDKVNVHRSYVRDLRALIHDWRQRGLEAAQVTHHEKYYKRHAHWREKPALENIVRGKLDFLKMVRGPADPVRKNLQRQLVAVWPAYGEVMEKENRELNMRDFFISHASEDKAAFVRPFVDSLIKAGMSVWYDEYEITIGDSLAAKINVGLTQSTYGILVLSPNFFIATKTWPEREMSAMLAMEDADHRPRILPIWHNVDQKFVAAKSPLLAGTMAWKSSEFAVPELTSKFATFLKAKQATA